MSVKDHNYIGKGRAINNDTGENGKRRESHFNVYARDQSCPITLTAVTVLARNMMWTLAVRFTEVR